MKFRHLEKVKVRSGYYRGYKGIIKDYVEDEDTILVDKIVYTVELLISKDPLIKISQNFSENELKKRWF